MLPFAPEPFADESLESYLQRLALAQFLTSSQQLLRPVGLRSKRLFSPDELKQFAEHYALEAQQLIEMAAFPSVSGALARGKFLRLRAAVCPQCLAEKPYLRQSWYHVLVTACRRHSAALLESCPGCRQPLSHHRGPLTHCSCGVDLSAMPQQTADAGNLLVSALISGEEQAVRSVQQQLGGLPCLPEDIDAFVVFLANLNRAQPWRRGRGITLGEAEALNRAAYHFLEDIPSSFQAFVRRRIQHANQRQSAKFITELGGWYRQLTRDFDRPEYAAVVRIAAECLVLHAIAPINRKMKQIGSDLLGMKSTYTTAETARLLGSSPDRIVAFVKAGRLRGQVLQGGAVEYCLVERTEVEEQQRLAAEVITRKDVQRMLNVSRHLGDRLIESGVLQRIPDVQRPLFGKGEFWRVEVEQLLARLSEACDVHEGGPTLSLAEISARQFPRDQLTELYRQIGSGQLKPVIRLQDIEGLASLRFDQHDILAIVAPAEAPRFELSITDLTKFTRWKHATIRGWIEAGWLPCRRETLRGRERIWISPAHLVEFLSRYVVVADAADQLKTKSVWLQESLYSRGLVAQAGHLNTEGVRRGLLLSTAALLNVATGRAPAWRRSVNDEPASLPVAPSSSVHDVGAIYGQVD
ncbi:TniQ family protein [Pseudomonas nitroreducens]|uniref:TniQ family protein n=1 Tax=Pseudomonas nitroreducens TaxID=46680 RepID=UPI0020A0AA93|nr:TniQ family protein [Pseudomonas nitroreducens]MCP1621516.1 hypothetical protein [Pseudomonas nitroreducens]